MSESPEVPTFNQPAHPNGPEITYHAWGTETPSKANLGQDRQAAEFETWKC